MRLGNLHPSSPASLYMTVCIGVSDDTAPSQKYDSYTFYSPGTKCCILLAANCQSRPTCTWWKKPSTVPETSFSSALRFFTEQDEQFCPRHIYLDGRGREHWWIRVIQTPLRQRVRAKYFTQVVRGNVSHRTGNGVVILNFDTSLS